MRAFLVLLALTAPALAQSPAYLRAVPKRAPITVPRGLIGYWRMDAADIAGTTVLDRSGQGVNLTNNGTTTTPGQIAQAAIFTGNNMVSQYPLSISTSSFSYCGGVKWTSSTPAFLISQTPSYGTNVNSYIVVNTTIGWGFYNGSNHGAGASASYNNGSWHHYCVTGASSGSNFYVDGAAVGTSASISQTINSAAGAFRLGSSSFDNGYNFTGQQDDVRVYNRPISAAEVAQIYTAFRAGHQ